VSSIKICVETSLWLILLLAVALLLLRVYIISAFTQEIS